MPPIVKHPTKKWEVSISEYEDNSGVQYKVTRRQAELSVAETKIFRSKEEAKKLFTQLLQ